MIYLFIIVVAAMSGILRLWFAQRRQRVHVDAIDGFHSSLERITTHHHLRPSGRISGGARTRSMPSRPYGRPVALDPARREAAKRRLEARRRAARRAS